MSSRIISVVIRYPIQPDYLSACVKASARQTFDLDRAEVIVVDNGSKELPEDIRSLFDVVPSIQDLTPDPAPTRNVGVVLSSGARPWRRSAFGPGSIPKHDLRG